MSELAKVVEQFHPQQNDEKATSAATTTAPKKRGRPTKAEAAARGEVKRQAQHPAPDIDEIFSFYSRQGGSNRAATMLLVGKSERGKTYLTKFLIDYITNSLNVFKFGIVFAKSASNGDWDFLPKNSVFDGWKQDKFEAYIKWLEQVRREKGDAMPCSFLVLDDLFGTKALMGNEAFDSFLARSRHLGVTVFNLVQYLNSAASSTILREQSSHVFMFNSKTKRTLTALFEWFGLGFDSYDEFAKYMEEKTKKDLNTAVLYIEKNEADNNYFSFKAPGPDTWTLRKMDFTKNQGASKEEQQKQPTSTTDDDDKKQFN